MSEPVYAIDMTIYVPGIGLVTKYFATDRINYSGNWYEPRLQQPGNFQQTVFSDGTTGGASQTGFGEIILINTDGALDGLIRYGFDGRPIVLRRIVDGVATILMTCAMEQPVPTWDTLPIRIKDKQLLFQIAIQPTKYAGTNALPSGVEGIADIQGKPKPLLFGQVSNATPVCVNTSRLIYQAHESMCDFPNVYDKGLALNRGTDYSSTSDMMANAPASGTYRVYPACGMFRLGSTPAGQITCDGLEGATAADRTAAQILKRAALRGITAGEISATDITTLDGLNSSVIGIYVNGESIIQAVMDEVANSVGAWYGFDPLGNLRMGRLDAPGGTPVVTLTRSMIKTIERQATNDAGRGVPPYKINLGYAKNYTVQQPVDLATRLANPQFIHGNFPAATTGVRVLGYGAGIYVGIGDRLFTSPDAVNWTDHAIPTGLSLVLSICYTGTEFIAVGDLSAIWHSIDGINWTSTTAVATGQHDIAYSNGVTVIAGTGSIYYSINNVTWNTVSLTGYWRSITATSSGFLAIADTNTSALSANGAAWTLQGMKISDTIYGIYPIYSVVYWLGTYVAVGSSGVIISSTDGIKWGLAAISFTNSYNWKKVVANNGVYIAITADSLYIATSTDTINWDLHVLSTTALGIPGMCMVDGMLIVTNTSIYLNNMLSSTRLSYLNKDLRTITSTNPVTLTKHPTGGELTLNTLLVNYSDANTESDRRLALYAIDRDYLTVVVPSDQLPAELLGRTIKVQIPRFGYNSGKLFVILGVTSDYESAESTLSIWG